MDSARTAEQQIENLDLGLFKSIPTESCDDDRVSWPLVQRSLRRALGAYVYLEIGSYLGGSLQQHVVDSRCAKVYSIDRRPLEQRDDRCPGLTFTYEGNSTARMLANIRSLGAVDMDKIVTFETDARDIDPARVEHAPDFCFIDGEHTKTAVLSDFQFCIEVCKPNAAICFHDDGIIDPALSEILGSLDARGVPHTALKLGGSTFLIGLRDCPVARDPDLLRVARSGERFLVKRRIRRLADRHHVPAFARRFAAWIWHGLIDRAS